MSDLVGNPEDWFSHNETHIRMALDYDRFVNSFGFKTLTFYDRGTRFELN